MKLVCAALILSALLWPRPLFAEDFLEKAGAGIGLTAGNALLVPLKVTSVFMGLTAGILSFILTGGDMEVARQTVQNSIEGPYLVTPEIADKAIGERPELQKQ